MEKGGVLGSNGVGVFVGVGGVGTSGEKGGVFGSKGGLLYPPAPGVLGEVPVDGEGG